jgi:hypothetical protein
MARYPATVHSAAQTACATAPSHCRGRTEATIVPTAAAPQPKATCRAKGALAHRAARRTSRIHSRFINEPPRPDIDSLPRHPATPGRTPLEILKRTGKPRVTRSWVCADRRGCVVRNTPNRRVRRRHDEIDHGNQLVKAPGLCCSLTSSAKCLGVLKRIYAALGQLGAYVDAWVASSDCERRGAARCPC